MYTFSTRFPSNIYADFGELQRQLDQFFGSRGTPSSIRAVRRGSFPAINMGTTNEAVEIYALAPGINPAELEVSIDRGLLTIAGERKSALPQGQDKHSVYACERFSGLFKRVVNLPEDVDSTQVNATYRNGILRVVIPKRESKKPLRIEVQNIN